jgi:hypothetical protein
VRAGQAFSGPASDGHAIECGVAVVEISVRRTSNLRRASGKITDNRIVVDQTFATDATNDMPQRGSPTPGIRFTRVTSTLSTGRSRPVGG